MSENSEKQNPEPTGAAPGTTAPGTAAPGLVAPKIVIRENGPYRVYGNVPLVHKTQVVSEFGEPLTWVKDKVYAVVKKPGRDYYSLCRCGLSKEMPFCDGAHKGVFDGTETADIGLSQTRSVVLPRGKRIIVKKDAALCMEAGFCGLHDASLEDLLSACDDPSMRSLVIAMVERCPSGALTYRLEPDGGDIEPDYPVQIAVTTEICSGGAIDGPLWVTGGIPIERADGRPFETRNRVTLCNCGHSCLKPLCDGVHRRIQEEALKRKV